MNGLRFFFCALLLGIAPIRADDAAAATPPPVTDPALVSQHFRQVLTRPQFQDAGEANLDPQIQDLLSQWFKRLGAKMGDLKYTSRMPAFESLLMTLLVAFSIAILLYIIMRLTRRHAWVEPEADEPGSGPKTLRRPEFYDEEIERAVRSQDWHAAWLASWRQFVSRLEQRSLVDADRTRTNREYLGQLRTKPLPSTALVLLTGMVDAYDRFIYGRAFIGEPDWNYFHRQIEEAALLLHLDDKRKPAITGPDAS